VTNNSENEELYGKVGPGMSSETPTCEFDKKFGTWQSNVDATRLKMKPKPAAQPQGKPF
jgi:hypothetical protein